MPRYWPRRRAARAPPSRHPAKTKPPTTRATRPGRRRAPPSRVASVRAVRSANASAGVPTSPTSRAPRQLHRRQRSRGRSRLKQCPPVPRVRRHRSRAAQAPPPRRSRPRTPRRRRGRADRERRREPRSAEGPERCAARAQADARASSARSGRAARADRRETGRRRARQAGPVPAHRAILQPALTSPSAIPRRGTAPRRAICAPVRTSPPPRLLRFAPN